MGKEEKGRGRNVTYYPVLLEQFGILKTHQVGLYHNEIMHKQQNVLQDVLQRFWF